MIYFNKDGLSVRGFKGAGHAKIKTVSRFTRLHVERNFFMWNTKGMPEQNGDFVHS